MPYTAPTIRMPHDRLFYQVFSRKEKAKAFFEKYLPPSILAIANLNQLTIIESKHISDAGLSLYDDIIYRCPLANGQTGYFFIICEHQSTPDKQMPLRLIKYNIVAIEDHLKQGHKHYPIVINTVLYTGKRPWNYSTSFNDYYADPALGSQYLSMAPFRLVTLPKDASDIVYTDKDLGFCWAAFYCGRNNDIYKSFAKFKEIPIFKQYFERLPAIERELVGRYLGWCVNRSRYSLEEIVNLIITNDKEKEIFMQSVAQEYFDQGLEVGKEKGRGEGREEGIFTKAIAVAKNMLLKLKLDMDTVQQATELPKAELEKILQGSR